MTSPDPMNADAVLAAPVQRRPLWKRYLPLIIIVLGLCAAWAFGLFDLLSLDTLRDQRGALTGFVADNLVLAVLVYLAIYALATVLMVPGSLWITIAGGFLFGLLGGTLATIGGATFGATLLFLAARTSFGDVLRRQAGPFLKKLEAGFRENPVSYMFFLRFVPAVPFPVANIAPALFGARLPQFMMTTALGIVPGVLAYTWIGAGLGATFDAGGEPDLGAFARQLFPAFVALALVALIPVAVKRYRKLKTP